MERATLYWKDLPLGVIGGFGDDFPWVTGDFEPLAEAEAFRGFFAFLVDEDQSDREPPFDPELLEEQNWRLVGETGEARGIAVPAVYLDEGWLTWRWR